MAAKQGRPFKCIVCSESVKTPNDSLECRECARKAHKTCVLKKKLGNEADFLCARCDRVNGKVNGLITSISLDDQPQSPTRNGEVLGLTAMPNRTNNLDSEVLLKILAKVENLESQMAQLRTEVSNLRSNSGHQQVSAQSGDKKKNRSRVQNNKEKVKNSENRIQESKSQEEKETKYSKNTIYMVEGNLLEAMDQDGFSTAHYVARDMNMGAGIALKLKNKLNIDTKSLRKDCQVTDVVELKVNKDYLLNLVTKKLSSELPSWINLKKNYKKVAGDL